jgi:apolipoprotein N-acyltransferase
MALSPGIQRAPSTASLIGRALLSGVLLFLAWPPLPFTFLLFVALVPWLQGVDAILASREDRGTIRSAWLFSYAMFLVWNGLTTWWVSLATLPGGIFAVLVNSLIMTLPVLIYLMARRRLGAGRDGSNGMRSPEPWAAACGFGWSMDWSTGNWAAWPNTPSASSNATAPAPARNAT